MDKNFEITLSLEDENSASVLKRKVYEDELKEINSKYPLDENKMDIKQTYFFRNDNTIEVGFFIRNGLVSNLSIEEMPLVIQDKNENIILSKNFNFKKDGVIPPHCARPFAVNFELTDGITLNEDEEYTIKFNSVNQAKAFYSVETEIENIPENISFEEEKEIKDFAMKIQTLKADEFAISLYKLAYRANGDVDCLLLLRNGSTKEARLDKLPVSIVNEVGEVIARKVVENEKGLVKISPKKAKLIKIEFESIEIKPEKCDLSKCNVIYQ